MAGAGTEQELWEALRGSGWLPRASSHSSRGSASDFSFVAPAASPGANLLPLLECCWQSEREANEAATCHARRMQDCLARQLARAAHLSLGIRRPESSAAPVCFPTRLAYLPFPLDGPWASVISSRLHRNLARYTDWLAAFRAACQAVSQAGACLLTAEATTTYRFMSAARTCCVARPVASELPGRRQTLPQWLRRLVQRASLADLDHRPSIWLSPPLDPAMEPAAAEDAPPLRDEALVSLSDWIFVLHLRPGGFMEQLLRRSLDSRKPVPRIRIPPNSQLVPRELAEELVSQGAEYWQVIDPIARPSKPDPCQAWPQPAPDPRLAKLVLSVDENGAPAPASILSSYPAVTNDSLTHCTRAPVGPWPDETEEEYLAELLSRRDAAERTAAETLRRIIEQRRLIAGSQGIRGGTRVVCFTAIPLPQLSQLRTFRSHRGRWDFEPFGISIDREWLAQRGTRPVVYGDDRTWASLASGEQPFFQFHGGRSAATSHPFDWTAEREWRHIGDVELDELPPHQGLVFVPSHELAEWLAAVSPWPVLILPPSGT